MAYAIQALEMVIQELELLLRCFPKNESAIKKVFGP